jgi:iron complex outermembrane receptor protein
MYHNYSRNDYSILNTHIKDTVNGEFTYPVVKNEDAAYRKYGIQQELYYRPVQEFFTSAKLWFQNANRSIPNVLSFEGSDDTYRKNRQSDQTMKAVVDGTYYGKNYQLKMSTGIDYQVLDYVMSIKNSGLEELKPVNSGSRMFSNYNHTGFRMNAGEKLSFQLSTDVNHFNISTLDSANNTGYDEKRTEYSVLSGIYVNPLKKVNFLFELRKDWIPNTEAPFIYNIGLSFKPFEKHDIELKSGFVRNFHHPSLNDLYWQPGGNPDLLPEEGHTAELGLHYIGQSGKVMINTEITGYFSDINNWILWLPSVRGYWEAMNLKNVTSRGVEFNLKGSLKVNELVFNLNGNYAFTRSTSTDPVNELNGTEGNQLPFIPKHSGNALAGISLKGFFIRYQYHYYGIRNLMNSNFEQPDDQFPYYRLYAHHLSSLNLGKDFHLKHFELGTELKIGNLFNETYRNVLNRFMPGRNFTFLLKISF